jgi:hypothetical protein
MPDLVYGHLRDFRDEPDARTLQAGSLCVVASRTLIVTGRRIPLLSVSGAIFLILELDRSFEGLLQVSSAPLRAALAQLGQ